MKTLLATSVALYLAALWTWATLPQPLTFAERWAPASALPAARDETGILKYRLLPDATPQKIMLACVNFCDYP